MIELLLRKVFGSKHDRDIKRLRPVVAAINELEPRVTGLSDADLRRRADEIRTEIQGDTELDDFLPEVFALVREAGRRSLGMRHFDVQLMGGMVLHQGKIAEMATGEGKTLVATLPAVLNGLTGRGVHIVTVNDYLARRDAEWMGPVYDALGLRAAFIQNLMPFDERKRAYEADITYGTNSEFGFDYLRDNMATSLEATVQRGHSYAIVDEVDSILIDEARTPLIISGEPETAAKTYYDFARVAAQLIPHQSHPGDPKGGAEGGGAGYEYAEKHKTIAVTEQGVQKV